MTVRPASTSGTANPTQGSTAELTIRLLALLEKMTGEASSDDVHKLRTSVRRIEVRLGHCSPKVAKSLRALRKKAGKVRDIDVHLGLLKSSLFTPATKSAAIASSVRDELRRILNSNRERDQKSLLRLVARAAPLLESRLPKAVHRAIRPEPDAAAARQLTISARRHYLQWTHSIPDAGAPLHRLRIDAKKLRYSLEPLAAFPDASEMAEHLKQVQDAIGSWHDWATLLELAGQKLRSASSESAFAALEARTTREFNKAHRTAERVRQWMIVTKSPASPTRGHSSPYLVRKAG